MAKVSIEFDTVEKTLSVSVDGKAVSNVVEAYISKSYYVEDGKEPGYGCSVTTLTEDEGEDIRTMTRLVASESLEGLEVTARAGVQKTPLEGFVVAHSRSKVEDDIARFFSRE